MAVSFASEIKLKRQNVRESLFEIEVGEVALMGGKSSFSDENVLENIYEKNETRQDV